MINEDVPLSATYFAGLQALLGTGLGGPAKLHRAVVHGQNHPIRAQAIAESEREIAGDRRLLDPDRADRPRLRASLGLGAWHPAPDRILHPELNEVQEIGLGKGSRDPSALENAREHDLATLDLDEEVADR